MIQSTYNSQKGSKSANSLKGKRYLAEEFSIQYVKVMSSLLEKPLIVAYEQFLTDICGFAIKNNRVRTGTTCPCHFFQKICCLQTFMSATKLKSQTTQQPKQK